MMLFMVPIKTSYVMAYVNSYFVIVRYVNQNDYRDSPASNNVMNYRLTH